MMIRSFRSKALEELFETGRSRKIDRRLHGRIVRRLDALAAAEKPEDVDFPGFNFHPLKGSPGRFSIHINGPWCITFEFVQGNAERVDLEQYH